jgi:hypothetical protein
MKSDMLIFELDIIGFPGLDKPNMNLKIEYTSIFERGIFVLVNNY